VYGIRFKTHKKIVPVTITTTEESYGSCYNMGSKQIVLQKGADLDTLIHEYFEAVVNVFRLELSHQELEEIATELTKLISWWKSAKNLTIIKENGNESAM
jgi:pyruvate kinase